MDTFCNIISKWPKISDFATDIGVKANHAKQMRTRDRIPAQYWRAVVDAANTNGYSDITFEKLADIAAEGLSSEPDKVAR